MGIRAVYERGQLRLLEQVDLNDGEQVEVTIQRGAVEKQAGKRLSAREMMKLPIEERDKLLAAASSKAESAYDDPELTNFEAYGDNDLYDSTP
jgi:predicted DNA-binding antitoxin AbrB/MazE fold protein